MLRDGDIQEEVSKKRNALHVQRIAAAEGE